MVGVPASFLGNFSHNASVIDADADDEMSEGLFILDREVKLDDSPQYFMTSEGQKFYFESDDDIDSYVSDDMTEEQMIQINTSEDAEVWY